MARQTMAIRARMPVSNRPRSVHPASRWRAAAASGALLSRARAVTRPVRSRRLAPSVSTRSCSDETNRGPRLLGGLEDITGPAQRMDHRQSTYVDLLAEVGDVELDHVCLPAEVVVPDSVEDL